MGGTSARDMQEEARRQGIKRRAVLAWHLAHNHYPPVHADFIPVAERALELAESGELDTPIEMPNGLTRSAGAIMDGLHLWDFVAPDEDADGEPIEPEDGEPTGA